MFPEQRLIVAACRSALLGDSLDVPVGEVDVAHAICLADEVGVLGLVSGYMRQRPDADIRWQAAWRANASRNVMLMAESAQWSTILRRHGIDPILFKGPALAKTAYGDVGSRDSCDVDLIVPHNQFRAALETCTRFGATVDLDVEALDLSRVGAVTLTVPRSTNTYSIDLHAGWIPWWGDMPNREIAAPDLVDLAFGRISFRTLGPELSLLQAAAHFWQHAFSLKTLTDVVATVQWVRRQCLERSCRRRAHDLRVVNGLSYAIAASDRFLETGELSTPPPIRHTIVMGLPQRDSLATWIWHERYRDRSWIDTTKGLITRLWGDNTLLQAPEWVSPKWIGVRRVLRPIRLFTKAVRLLPMFGRPAWRSRQPLRFRRPD